MTESGVWRLVFAVSRGEVEEAALRLKSPAVMGRLGELVRHLYVDLEQSTGGPLHLVLDDGNVDDHWLAEDESRYNFLFDGGFEEYAQAGDDVSEERKQAIRDTCELILAELRPLTLPARSDAVRAAYNAAMEAR